MKLYYSLSQIPELGGLKGSARRAVLRSASKLLKRDDPWFTPSLVWLFSMGSGFFGGLATVITIGTESSVGLASAVGIGLASIIPLAAISALAAWNILVSRTRSYIRQVRGDNFPSA